MSEYLPPVTYRQVAILRPGSFTDDRGRRVRFTEAGLERLADSYDPAYHCAPVNLEHRDEGPAGGYVAGLAYRGGMLYADLAGVPSELAAQIDAGRYPFRSAEVYAALDGRGPYLRAVALLGARPPAVKGLPPMPHRQRVGEAGRLPAGGMAGGTYAAPAGAIHLERNRLATARRPPRAPRIITLFTEV
jgi:hypothetical protein